MQEERAPVYLVIGRILVVLAMSFAAAAAILFAIGGYFTYALVAIAIAIPFAALMRGIEIMAWRKRPPSMD
ncbi:MAG: hypothetical protein EXR43_01405 [Dehalococcoidia bacterium]|nr:hypothetical protein [Dehalococcoidia bacterium]